MRFPRLAIAAALIHSAPAAAQDDPPDYGLDWVRITHPGNRPTIPSEVPSQPKWQIGAVDHNYRIMRSEVTVGQWYEFVVAYAPYWKGSYNDNALTGDWINWDGNQKNPGFSYDPSVENIPTNLSWHNAARYCNWLCNGKAANEAAFQNGAYDDSTFTKNEDGTWNDQPTHNPGALFWIPSWDEWVKAMHYDPNRYGPGQEGYWLYPASTDTPLVSDWPWNGGETGTDLELGTGPYLDVGSYPWTQSPWRVLDGSGGEAEWMENLSSDHSARFAKWGRQFMGLSYHYERIDQVTGAGPQYAVFGVRIASAVPAPLTVAGLSCLIPFFARRHRS